MSIRDAAAGFVSDLIGHIKPQGLARSNTSTLYLLSTHNFSNCTDGDTFQVLILTTMLVAVKKGLRSKLEFARQEFITVLSQLVKAYQTHPRFSSMAALSHHEPEADFFENVKHIQLHRRTRAFRKLATLCAEGSLTQACVMNFILPLANHVSLLPLALFLEAIECVESISNDNITGSLGCVYSSHQHWAESCCRDSECDWFNFCSAQLVQLLLPSSSLPQAVTTETRHSKNTRQVSIFLGFLSSDHDGLMLMKKSLVKLTWWSHDILVLLCMLCVHLQGCGSSVGQLPLWPVLGSAPAWWRHHHSRN